MQVLTAAQMADDSALIEGIAGFYRAMSLLREGKSTQARALFTATEAAMIPLPNDEQYPYAGGKGIGHDHLVLWLAYKEAKAMLQIPAISGKR